MGTTGLRQKGTMGGAGRRSAACAPSLLISVLSIILLAVALLLSPCAALAAREPPAVTPRAAILIDSGSGRILFSRNADDRLPMASTTKIMTAVVVLDRLPLDTEVTASRRASETIGSGIELQEGETFTAQQLLSALLIHSANDGAVALAEATAGSVEAFVDLMNEKAAALGLADTHFANPHGMNAPNHYSSARDLATLAFYAMQNKLFRSIVDSWSFDLPRETGIETFTNRNLLLQRQGWVNGIKTGSTPKAGNCLVASGSKDGVELISVVLGATDEDACWDASLSLLEYGYDQYRRVLVTSRDDAVTTVPLPFPSQDRLELVASRTLVLTVFAEHEVHTTVHVEKNVRPPLEHGDVLGSVVVSVDGRQIDTVPLLAARSVEQSRFTSILRHVHSLWPPGLDFLGLDLPASSNVG